MSEPIVMPDFLRKAIEAQGKCDPDEVLALAAGVDLDAPIEHEPQVLFEPPPRVKKWYED